MKLIKTFILTLACISLPGTTILCMPPVTTAPIITACKAKEWRAVRSIIQTGGDLSQTDEDGNNALHYAIRSSEDSELVKILLNAKALINAFNKAGKTPLMIAVEQRDPFFTRLLIDSGALVQITHSASKNISAPVLAQKIAKEDVANGSTKAFMSSAVEDILSLPSKFSYATANPATATTEVQVTCKTNAKTAFETTIQIKAAPGTVIGASAACTAAIEVEMPALRDQSSHDDFVYGPYGKSQISYPRAELLEGLRKRTIIADDMYNADDAEAPLITAARLGDLEVVSTLLDHGLTYIGEINNEDQTALHKACQYGHQKIVETLIEEGVGLNTTDKDGFTPLMTAVHKNKLSCVTTLLEYNVKLNIINKQNQTALMISVMHNVDPSIVQALLKAGADISIKSKGESPDSRIKERCRKLINKLSSLSKQEETELINAQRINILFHEHFKKQSEEAYSALMKEENKKEKRKKKNQALIESRNQNEPYFEGQARFLLAYRYKLRTPEKPATKQKPYESSHKCPNIILNYLQFDEQEKPRSMATVVAPAAPSPKAQPKPKTLAKLMKRKNKGRK